MIPWKNTAPAIARRLACFAMICIAHAANAEEAGTNFPGAVSPADIARSFRQQIMRCWAPPATSKPVVVPLDIRLRIDGQLAAPPTPGIERDTSDPDVRTAVDAATKAVRACAPYIMPAAQYDIWREIKLNFDPRTMYPRP